LENPHGYLQREVLNENACADGNPMSDSLPVSGKTVEVDVMIFANRTRFAAVERLKPCSHSAYGSRSDRHHFTLTSGACELFRRPIHLIDD
jgi:hypothetical protein